MLGIDNWLPLLAKFVDKVVFGFSDYNEVDSVAEGTLDKTEEPCEVINRI